VAKVAIAPWIVYVEPARLKLLTEGGFSRILWGCKNL